VLVLTRLGLGELITSEIERGVRSSRVTIVVVSASALADRWAGFAEQIAACACVARQGHGILLPVLLDDCELPARLRALTALDFRSSHRGAWQAEIARLRAYLDRPPPAEPELLSPYSGLRQLTADDAGKLLGREIDIDRIMLRLQRGEREIYIVGPSGSGKSSLIAAGLVPRLTGDRGILPGCHAEVLRPGPRPYDRIRELLGDPAAPGALDGLLARRAARSLLLVIDPLDDVLALGDGDQRRGWWAALGALRSDPRCILVAALRSDFYPAFMASPPWTDRAGAIARLDLAPLGTDALRAIIERPARDRGVYVQPELVSRLLDDVAGEPAALALLQETLQQLWTRRRQRVITLDDYHALGDGVRAGVAFVVGEHADCVLDTLAVSQRATAFRMLIRLVSFGEGRADTRRQQSLAALRSDSDADFDEVLQRLVDGRLMRIGCDDPGGAVRVDLAHEILIEAWPAFAAWIRTWRGDEQRRRALESAAVAWRARGSGDSGLLDAVELAEAIAWRDRGGRTLGHSGDVSAFLAASANMTRRPSRCPGQVLHGAARNCSRRALRRASV
jgi:energy-coupling factor transporter ATP-binding protein EcfA2